MRKKRVPHLKTMQWSNLVGYSGRPVGPGVKPGCFGSAREEGEVLLCDGRGERRSKKTAGMLGWCRYACRQTHAFNTKYVRGDKEKSWSKKKMISRIIQSSNRGGTSRHNSMPISWGEGEKQAGAPKRGGGRKRFKLQTGTENRRGKKRRPRLTRIS